MKSYIFAFLLVCSTCCPRARADSYAVTVNFGWSLIADQLDIGGNTWNEVFPWQKSSVFNSDYLWLPRRAGDTPADIVFAPGETIPPGSFDDDYSAGSFFIDNQWQWNNLDALGEQWISVPFTPNQVIHPGDGIAVYHVSAPTATYTFQGTARAPTGQPVNIPAGASRLLAAQTATNGTYEIVVGAPPVEGSQVYRLNTNAYPQTFYGSYAGYAGHFGPPDYNVYTFSNGAWTPEPPVLNIGEAAWFRAPPPALGLQLQSTNTLLSWTTNAVPFSLQGTDQLVLSNAWNTVTNPVVLNGSSLTVSVPFTATDNRFYRLLAPPSPN